MSEISKPGFWGTKEGKYAMGYVAIAAGVVLALVGINPVIGWFANLFQNLVMLTQNMTKFLLSLAGLGVVGYLLFFSKRFHALVYLAYAMTFRRLTALFIALDPPAVLRERAKKMRERSNNVKESKKTIGGIERQISESAETSDDEANGYLTEASRLERTESDKVDRIRALKQLAGGALENRKECDKQLRRIKLILVNLDKLMEKIDVRVMFADQRAKQLESKHRTTQALKRAFRSVLGVFRGEAIDDFAQQAEDMINSDSANAFGELEAILDESETFFDTDSLKEFILMDNAEERLAEMQRRIEGITERPALTDGSTSRLGEAVLRPGTTERVKHLLSDE